MEETMNKNELLEVIKKLKPKAEHLMNLSTEVDQEFRLSQKSSFTQASIVFFGAQVIGVPIGLILYAIMEESVFLLGGISWIVLFWITYRSYRKAEATRKVAQENHRKLKEQFENIGREYYPEFESYSSEIPVKYTMNYLILIRIESYLVDMRAETIKEAINLFQEEKSRNEMVNTLADVVASNERLIQETKKLRRQVQ